MCLLCFVFLIDYVWKVYQYFNAFTIVWFVMSEFDLLDLGPTSTSIRSNLSLLLRLLNGIYPSKKSEGL